MRNRFRIFQIESCTINAIYSLPVHVDERARNRRYIGSQGIFGPISTNSHHPIKNPAYGPAPHPFDKRNWPKGVGLEWGLGCRKGQLTIHAYMINEHPHTCTTTLPSPTPPTQKMGK